MTKAHLFTKPDDREYTCLVWFERDRQNISLTSPRGRVVFDLWDEDVSSAIEDGFLTSPPFFKLNDESAWQPHAVAFARQVGLIK